MVESGWGAIARTGVRHIVSLAQLGCPIFDSLQPFLQSDSWRRPTQAKTERTWSYSSASRPGQGIRKTRGEVGILFGTEAQDIAVGEASG